MAVGAGSIKRASKLNADAESKKAVEAPVESAPVETTEEKAPAKKSSTTKSTATKSTNAKTTTKSAATKTTTKKAPAKKTAEKPAEAVPAVEASVITNIDPVVLDVVLSKKPKANKACHLTEDMPIHLL